MFCSLEVQSTLRAVDQQFFMVFFSPIKLLSRLRVDVSVTRWCEIVVHLP